MPEEVYVENVHLNESLFSNLLLQQDEKERENNV